MAASAVGLTLIPFGLIIGLLSRRAGGLADRYGARNFLVGGSLVVALGAAWIALSLENFWIGVFVPLIVMALRHGGGGDAADDGGDELGARRAGRRGLRHQQRGKPRRRACRGRGARRDRRSALSLGRRARPSARFGELPAAGDPSRATLEQAFVVAYSGAMAIAAIWCVLAARDGVLLAHRAGLHGVRGAGRAERSLSDGLVTRRRTPTSRARSCAGRRSPARPRRDPDATPASGARRR